MGFFDTKNTKTRHTTSCSACKLFQTCASPCMNSIGTGSNGILLLLPPPSKHEDVCGVVGSNDLNQWLFRKLADIGIDYKECTVVNSLGCYTEAPKGTHFAHCINRINNIVAKVEPKLVISFGESNLQSTVKQGFSRNIGDIERWVQSTIPFYRWNCWLSHVRSPEELLYHERYEKNSKWVKEQNFWNKIDILQRNGTYKSLMFEFQSNIKQAYIKSKQALPIHIDKITEVKILSQSASIKWMQTAMDYLDTHKDEIVEFDLETSSLNLRGDDTFVYSASFCYQDHTSASFLVTKDNLAVITAFLKKEYNWCGHNFKYDAVASHYKLGHYPSNLKWDTMIASHWLNNKGAHSLKHEAFVRLGIEDYESETESFIHADMPNGINKIREAPVEKILLYGGKDTLYTRAIRKQQELEYLAKDVPNKEFALKLFFKGSIALGEIEIAGMPLNIEIAKENIKFCQDKMAFYMKDIEATDTWALWKKTYGDEATVLSDAQTIDILYKQKGLYPEGIRKGTKFQANEEWLSRTKDVICPIILRYKKYQKMESTYLSAFINLQYGGLLNSSYSLTSTESFRGSSFEPNLQNVPSHDEEASKLLKGCFVAPKGYQIGETDLAAAEMRVTYTYTGCDLLYKYLTDNNFDMHSAAGMKMGAFTTEAWDHLGKVNKKAQKEVRGASKSFVTFSLNFGNYYKNMGPLAWTGIKDRKLMYDENTTLIDYLKIRFKMEQRWADYQRNPVPLDGMILEEDEFYSYCYTEYAKEIEDDFWDRFKEVKTWREAMYQYYLDNGIFYNHTGFFYMGYHTRNQVGNFPVQSASFHILLWSICRIQYLIKKRGFKSRIINTIHDSIVSLIKVEERDEYLKMVEHVITVETKEVFPWLNIVMEIESELAPEGGAWCEKKLYVVAA